MVEREELERSLALARQALRGPAAMKARVRAQLVAGGASGASAPARLDGALPSGAPQVTAKPKASLASLRRLLARRPHLGTVAVLVGLGFGAGFWLGRQPSDPLGRVAVGSPSAATQEEPPALSTTHEAVTRAPLGPGNGSATRDAAGLVGAGAPVQPAGTDVPINPLASTSRAVSGDIEPTSRRALSKPASSKSAALARARDSAASATRDDEALMLEVSLLQRADRAIRAGEGALALGLLDELGRQVHAPRLHQEAAAARVLARCVRTGARSVGSLEEHEARAGAERFLAESAASVYAERIRSACPLEAKAAEQRTSSEEPNSAGH